MKLEEIKSIFLDEVEKDINYVNDRIEDINRAIDLIDKEKKQAGNVSLEKRYKKLKYKYFLEENKKLIEEILFFKSNIDLLSDYLFHSHENRNGHLNNFDRIIVGSIHSKISYKFSLEIETKYNPDTTHELNYIFGRLPVGDSNYVKEINEFYQTKDLNDDFYNFCKLYIDKLIIPDLKSTLENNFYLQNRKFLINHVLAIYENRDYTSLAYILPSLIEGTFHDICETIGLTSIKFDKASISESLGYIYKTVGYIYGFEYLLFEFPIKRNRIAHGRINLPNYRGLAVSFLMDFGIAMDLAKNPKIPINNLLKIIAEPSFKEAMGLYKFKYEYLPECVKEKYRTLGDFFIKPEFWIDLGNHCKYSSKSIQDVKYFLKKIIGNKGKFDHGDEIKNKAIEFLKNHLPKIEEDLKIKEEERSRFLEKLRKNT